MSTITAAQERVIANAVVLAATELLFTSMRKLFSCPALAEVVTIHNGEGLRAEDRDQTGQYYVYAAGGLVGRHTVSLNDRPFVVIGRKGSAGKTTYAPFGGWVIDTAYYAQPNDEKRLDCEFLYYAISSLDLSGDIISTAIPGINRTSIYQHSIPLPPREIQEATVRFLKASADRSESSLPELPLPLQPVRSTVIRVKELSAKIEEARELRQKAKEEAVALVVATSDEVFLPKTEWTEARVGEFCEQPQYGYTASASSEAVGPRLLRITDIQDGLVNWDSVPYCYCPDPTKYLLKENDIVFARTGATTGKSFLLRQCPDAVFASYLIRLRVRRWLTPDDLYRYFQTTTYWQQIADEKKGTGQPNINGKKLAMVRVPIPPVSEQRRIVAYLDDLQKKVNLLKKYQEETEKELDALMPSILSRAFSGTL